MTLPILKTNTPVTLFKIGAHSGTTSTDTTAATTPMSTTTTANATATTTQSQSATPLMSQSNNTAVAAAATACYIPTVEQILPGIFFTKDFINWNEQKLREQAFKYIIIIDKHIQELYYPAHVFKQIAQLPHSYGLDYDYDYDCSDAVANLEMNGTKLTGGTTFQLSSEFETLDLNFGQDAYLTTVLPNCYRAVHFIRKAQSNGSTARLLIIDCSGGEQKCVTIVVAYLMYKFNSSFRDAFARLKNYYKKADLDRFYANQLYEYEPILKVQRATAGGHSCSRAVRAALYKRKQCGNDEMENDFQNDDANGNCKVANKFLNPLGQFKPFNQLELREQNVLDGDDLEKGANGVFDSMPPQFNGIDDDEHNDWYMTDEYARQQEQQQQQQQLQHTNKKIKPILVVANNLNVSAGAEQNAAATVSVAANLHCDSIDDIVMQE